MKKSARTKSSFHKLYLIDAEMYNRILPSLNEVDKEELHDLNESNRPYDDLNDENPGETTEEPQQVNTDSDVTPPDVKNTDKSPPPTITEKTSEMKTKKFGCEICVNKKFTTKQSLKRHHKTFHEKKQSIKEAVRSSPIEEETTSIKEPHSNTLKRKFQDDSEDFSKDQPALKLAKYTDSPNIQNPHSKTIKRKFQDDSEDFSNDQSALESPNIQEQKGTKRKGPKRATDYMPRKKFHWESF